MIAEPESAISGKVIDRDAVNFLSVSGLS